MYRDGELLEYMENAFWPMAGIEAFAISGPVPEEAGEKHKGRVDDFRVYDYVLSQGEILNIVSDGQSYQPQRSFEGDYNGDGNINFEDFVLFADNWLDDYCCQ